MRFTSESAVGDSWLLSFSTSGGSRRKRYLETRLSAVLFVTAYGTSPHGSPPSYTPVVTVAPCPHGCHDRCRRFCTSGRCGRAQASLNEGCAAAGRSRTVTARLVACVGTLWGSRSRRPSRWSKGENGSRTRARATPDRRLRRTDTRPLARLSRVLGTMPMTPTVSRRTMTVFRAMKSGMS